MIEPPRLASWLLEVTSLPDRDVIAGDLREEFCDHIVPTRSITFARLWYVGQVMRSLAPLFFRAWQRVSVTRAATAIIAAAAAALIPAAALLSLRSFTLSQVPLKASADVSGLFALLLLVVGGLSAVIGLTIGLRLLNHRD